MNKHTLNYHTRLHDWYRQHSIRLDAAQQQPSAQDTRGSRISSAGPAGPRSQSVDTSAAAVAAAAAAAGALSQDKLYFINEWCADVNNTLFRVVRKESPPLYRRCRFSAQGAQHIQATTIGRSYKSADPRRIRSAEVFTMSGHWTKQGSRCVGGGELLPSRTRSGVSREDKPEDYDHDVTSDKGRSRTKYSESRQEPQPAPPPSSGVDLCVTNSKDESVQGKAPAPRVNHDSLGVSVRLTNRPGLANVGWRRSTVSRRVASGGGQASMVRMREQNNWCGKDMSNSNSGINSNKNINNNDNNKTSHPRNHRELELLENAKNEEDTRRHHIDVRKPGLPIRPKTGNVARRTHPQINAITAIETERHVVPTFCNTCSGIYSGMAKPQTPRACGTCVHGINIDGVGEQQLGGGIDANDGENIIVSAEQLASKLLQHEVEYGKKISSTEVEVKKVEMRLTEDSVHYNRERKTTRHGSRSAQYFLVPNTFDNLQDERNSFDEEDGKEAQISERNEEQGMDEVEDGHVVMRVTIQTPGSSPEEQMCNGHEAFVKNEEEDEEEEKKEEEEDNLPETDDRESDSCSNTEACPPNLDQRRGSRRKSISFEYKPSVSNVSRSNKLLNVLSIDDCKMSMRYSPHKVLEEHEVEDSPRVESEVHSRMVGQGTSVREGAKNSTSKIAMRLSRNSNNSGTTSLHTSAAMRATSANRKHYKNLYEPENATFLKNTRLGSACLAQAFHTLIHDRTVLQLLDAAGPTRKARTAVSVGEGQGYRRAHTALRRHMESMLHGQCSSVRTRYERLRSAAPAKGEMKGSPPAMTPASDISLSLESLPEVRKGILKASNESLHIPSENDLH